jgi:UTP--glucose-1-phosphate uridylyltransferase
LLSVPSLSSAGGYSRVWEQAARRLLESFLPVKGKPIIDYVIRNVLTVGEVDEIIVAISGTIGSDFHERILSHTHGICVDSYLRSLNHRVPVRTIPSPQRETAGDLLHVLMESDCKKGTVLVAYGDNLTDVNLQPMIDYHRECKKKLNIAATVLLFEVPEKDVNRFGIAKIKESGGFSLIESFVEKPDFNHAPSRLANAGYYIFDVEDIFHLFPKEKIKMEQSIFPILASQNKLAAFVAKLPFWIDIGDKEAYEEANKLAHDNLIIPPPLPNGR